MSIASHHPLPPHTAAALLAATMGCAVVALVLQFDAIPVLGLMVVLGVAAAMLLRPETATLAVVLLLYINVPAILTQQHGITEPLAGSMILLLGVPIVHRVMVREEPLRADPVFYLMLALLVVLLLSSIGAVDRTLALTRVAGYVTEGLLVYWLVVNAIRDLPTLRRVMATLILAGSFVSALCLYQEITGQYHREFGGLAYRNYDVARDGYVGGPRDERGKWDRAQGPVNEPNRFAQIMVVLLPLAVCLYRSARAPASRIVVAGATALILAGIVLTLSRGAIVAMVLLALAMAYLKWVRPASVALCAAGLLIAVPAITPFYLDRITSIANVTYLVSDDASGYREADGAIRGRATEMLAALHVFLDHPVLGVGPGQFAPFYVERYSTDPEIKFREIRAPRRAHTLYFELAAETGLIGLTVFLGIVLGLVRRLWRARCEWLHRDPALADLATAFCLSLLLYLWTAIFLHMAYQRYYWFLLAIATAALHGLASARSPGEARRVSMTGGRPWRPSR